MNQENNLIEFLGVIYILAWAYAAYYLKQKFKKRGSDEKEDKENSQADIKES